MLRSVLTLILTVGSISLVQAQSTIYTSSATFFSHVEAGYYTENFTDNAGYFTTGLLFSSGPISFKVDAAGGEGDTIYKDGSFIMNNFTNEALTFTITSGNVTAIGGAFLLTDADVNIISGIMTITLSDGTTTTFTTSISGDDYRGFVSPGPAITSLTLSAPGIGAFNTVDNLTLGFAASIPEPSTVALIGVLGTGFGAYWYRRRNKKDAILA